MRTCLQRPLQYPGVEGSTVTSADPRGSRYGVRSSGDIVVGVLVLPAVSRACIDLVTRRANPKAGRTGPRLVRLAQPSLSALISEIAKAV